METLICDKGEMASPSSKAVVVDAVMLLLAVTVAIGKSLCSSTRDQGGSGKTPRSPAAVASFSCSHVVGGSAKVSTAGELDCCSVLDSVLEGSRVCVDWVGPYTQDCFVLEQPPHTGFFSSHLT